MQEFLLNLNKVADWRPAPLLKRDLSTVVHMNFAKFNRNLRTATSCHLPK